MAKDFLTEPPNDTQQDAEPTDDRENREPVRIMVVGSRQGITAVVNWLVRLGFAQMADWSNLQRATEYGRVDARADKMVAEELRLLTSRAIAFPKPDVWESCDRPQLANRFNVRNIILLRDRLDDAMIGQKTGLSIKELRNLRYHEIS